MPWTNVLIFTISKSSPFLWGIFSISRSFLNGKLDREKETWPRVGKKKKGYPSVSKFQISFNSQIFGLSNMISGAVSWLGDRLCSSTLCSKKFCFPPWHQFLRFYYPTLSSFSCWQLLVSFFESVFLKKILILGALLLSRGRENLWGSINSPFSLKSLLSATGHILF